MSHLKTETVTVKFNFKKLSYLLKNNVHNIKHYLLIKQYDDGDDTQY